MNTFVFGSSYTWRKAGFLAFSNSLAYRDILEANPGWDITSLPVPGTPLKGENFRRTPGIGGFPMASNLFPSSVSSSFYPFNSKDSYVEALVKYSPSALRRVEECNGYSSTSARVTAG